MTREFLLKASITEFKDNEKKVIAIPFKRVYTPQGYSYLILDRLQAKEVYCAIHINREYVVTEEIGRLYTTSIDFSTREKFDIESTLFIYKGIEGKTLATSNKDNTSNTSNTSNPDNTNSNECILDSLTIKDNDLIFFAKSFDGYNASMKQYMYAGFALTIDKKNLLEPLNDVYGYSSFDILSNMPNYDILPAYAYIENKIHNGVIILNIESNEPISMPHHDFKSFKQVVYEDISFNLIHLNRLEVAKFIEALYDYSQTSNLFGVCSSVKIDEFADLQEEAALRGQAVKVSLRISYCMNVEYDKASNYIKEVVWRVYDELENEMGEFKASIKD